MNDFAEIDRMTLYEYHMRMTAFRLRQADREYEIHLQAWAKREINAKKKSGKKKLVFLYDHFKRFFDYEKRVREILHPEGCKGAGERSQGIFDLMKKQKERSRGDGEL